MSLFAPAPSAAQAGYRLAYFEILNWGTFDGTPQRLTFDGRNALLTGANGAGKTTLLDALLTLLVPPGGTGQRVYNAAAGTSGGRGSRAEEKRSDETYVLGHYGQTQREGQQRASAEALRDKRSHTVLLACFENTGLDLRLTVAQVFRYRPSGELRTDFLLAPAALGISDLGSFDPAGKWKGRLTGACQAEFFPSFAAYATRLRGLMGMGEKALALFGKSVALKELTSLNHFVRHEMLSEGAAESTFERLQQQYGQLLAIDKAIRKATRQVELLAPLPAAHAQWQQAQTRQAQAELLGALVHRLLSERMAQALHEELEATDEELTRLNYAVKTTAREKETAQDQRDNLNAALKNNEANQQREALKTRRAQLQSTLAQQKQTAHRYAGFAQALGFSPRPDADLFGRQRQQATEREATLQAALAGANTALAELLNKLTEARQQHRDVADELAELRARPGSKIPRDLQELRRKLLAHLGHAALSPDDLPFAGELLQVRPDAHAWEPALEKLLHGFALHLLVPAAHYAPLTEYVNRTRLGLRLVYQRLPDAAALGRAGQAAFPARTVGGQLDFLDTSPLRGWLSQQVGQHFPHLCAHDTAELQQHDGHALTREGLIRRGNRHEKDDRRPLEDTGRYVLGWNNLAKQANCVTLLVRYDGQIKALEAEQDGLEADHRTRDRQRQAARDLLQFDDYAALDEASTVRALLEADEQEKRLLASSDQLRELENQLAAADAALRQLEAKGKDQDKQKWDLERRLSEIKKRQQKAQAVDEPGGPALTPELLAAAAPYLPPLAAALDYEQWEERRLSSARQLLDEHRAARDEHEHSEKAVDRLLERFASPPNATLAEFADWPQEVPPADPEAANCADFLAVLAHLEHEALPPLREQFARYLREELAIGIINFRASLDNEKTNLERDLRELNQSLRGITFNSRPAPTFIRLVHKPTDTPRINAFRRRLAHTRTDLNSDLGAELGGQQATFREIKALIEELGDRAFRQEVTDVRQWFSFAAHEFAQPVAGAAPADGPAALLRVYESSRSLSGGQQAQLTYTILGAAVAHQFGINQQGLQSKSFRFLAVDEAFSKLDADNSRYLMRLCQELHLQLLVVTPVDKIGVVEEFVHSCHFVASPDRRTSQVFHLSRAELTERIAAARRAEAAQ